MLHATAGIRSDCTFRNFIFPRPLPLRVVQFCVKAAAEQPLQCQPTQTLHLTDACGRKPTAQGHTAVFRSRVVLHRAILRRAILHRAVLRRSVLRQSRCRAAIAVPNHATHPRTDASRHELTAEGYTAIPQQGRFASYVLRQSRRSTAVAVPDHATFSPHRHPRMRTDRRGLRYGCSVSYRSESKRLQCSCCNSGPR